MSSPKTNTNKHFQAEEPLSSSPKNKKQKSTNTMENMIHLSQNSKEVNVLRVVLASEHAKAPVRATALSAGYDLHSAESKVVPANGSACIDTGIKIAVPKGTYGRVASRSGLAVKNSIHTGAGVIDADYRGIVKVLLYNLGNNDFEVKRGDRIAQLILEKIELADVEVLEDLDDTSRGAGGFGSTGMTTLP